MANTREDVVPSLIENTTMQKLLRDGVHIQYTIKAIEGYVLHDKVGDWTEMDEMTGEEILKEAFFTGTCSCAASYDFEANPREFYAIPESSVPADQIFGGVDNDHEIM